jgi:hypothetical protein
VQRHILGYIPTFTIDLSYLGKFMTILCELVIKIWNRVFCLTFAITRACNLHMSLFVTKLWFSVCEIKYMNFILSCNWFQTYVLIINNHSSTTKFESWRALLDSCSCPLASGIFVICSHVNFLVFYI